MQIHYVGIEDRLLLRINTQNNSEFRLWLTRRYCKELRKALDRLLDTSSQQALAQNQATATTTQTAATSSPQAAAAVRHFEKEQALSKADFKAKYKQATDMQLPLGEKPILLSKLAIKPKDVDHIVCMHPKEGQGLEIVMNKELLHTFHHLLEEGIKRSDWDLSIAPPFLSYHSSSNMSH